MNISTSNHIPILLSLQASLVYAASKSLGDLGMPFEVAQKRVAQWWAGATALKQEWEVRLGEGNSEVRAEVLTELMLMVIPIRPSSRTSQVGTTPL